MTVLINSTRCRARIFLFCLDNFFYYSFKFQGTVIKKIIILKRQLHRGWPASSTNLLLLQEKHTSFTQVSQGTLSAMPNCYIALSRDGRVGMNLTEQTELHVGLCPCPFHWWDFVSTLGKSIYYTILLQFASVCQVLKPINSPSATKAVHFLKASSLMQRWCSILQLRLQSSVKSEWKVKKLMLRRKILPKRGTIQSGPSYIMLLIFTRLKHSSNSHRLKVRPSLSAVFPPQVAELVS